MAKKISSTRVKIREDAGCSPIFRGKTGVVREALRPPLVQVHLDEPIDHRGYTYSRVLLPIGEVEVCLGTTS